MIENIISGNTLQLYLLLISIVSVFNFIMIWVLIGRIEDMGK